MLHDGICPFLKNLAGVFYCLLIVRQRGILFSEEVSIASGETCQEPVGDKCEEARRNLGGNARGNDGAAGKQSLQCLVHGLGWRYHQPTAKQ